MKKTIFYLLFLIIGVQQTSAQVINTQYKAQSFEEMLKPLQMYTDAHNKAEADIESYYERFSTELESPRPDYRVALYFIDKCIELNTRFQKKLADHGTLLYNKGYVQYNTGDYRNAYSSFYNAHLAGNKGAMQAMNACKAADSSL